MSRLTTNENGHYYIKHKDMGSQSLLDMNQLKLEIEEMIQKLGSLEDILEQYDMNPLLKLSFHLDVLKELAELKCELGVDLITLFKALKQVRLFYKDENGNINQCEISRLGFQLSPAFIFMYKGYDENNNLKCVACEPTWRYGKTWALTKEELE